MTVSFTFTDSLRFYPANSDYLIQIPIRVVENKGTGVETDMRCPVCLDQKPARYHDDPETMGYITQYGHHTFTEPYDDNFGFCRTCKTRINIDHIHCLTIQIRK